MSHYIGTEIFEILDVPCAFELGCPQITMVVVNGEALYCTYGRGLTAQQIQDRVVPDHIDTVLLPNGFIECILDGEFAENLLSF